MKKHEILSLQSSSELLCLLVKSNMSEKLTYILIHSLQYFVRNVQMICEMHVEYQ